MLKERLMNPGTATFGSDGNVKPKELFYMLQERYVGRRGIMLWRITKGMLDKREP